MTSSKRAFRSQPVWLSRRQWLVASAAALATAPLACSSAAAQAEKKEWTMKLSTSSLHYRGLSLTEAVQRIAALGFQGIDVWAHFEWAGPVCEHLEEGLKKMGPEKFGSLLREHKLVLNSASCYSAPFSQFAKLLGDCGGCVVVRGSSGVEGTDLTAAQLTRQMKQFFESLKPELELAEKYNCAIAIENHSGASLLNKLDSLRAFTELNEHPRLGIALAPYHIQLNGESVEEAIRVASGQLKFFYAWQHGEGTSQLPGIGPTDMRPWLRALAAIDYAGFVNPFMHFEPEPDEMDAVLKKSRQYLLSAATDIRQT
ncbi:MAG: sugar phosphate isomerase/epimerase family protein [Pirellulaceae bacterium]